jgi:hypothetical protein
MGATIDGRSRLTVGRNPWAILVKQIVDAIVRCINSRMQCSWLLVVAGGCWLLLLLSLLVEGRKGPLSEEKAEAVVLRNSNFDRIPLERSY